MPFLGKCRHPRRYQPIVTLSGVTGAGDLANFAEVRQAFQPDTSASRPVMPRWGVIVTEIVFCSAFRFRAHVSASKG